MHTYTHTRKHTLHNLQGRQDVNLGPSTGVLHVLTYLAFTLALVKLVIFVPILQKEKQTQKVKWFAQHCTANV